MYPKKLEILEREKPYEKNTTSWWYNKAINDMTQEIRKRADVERLAKILEETELTMPDGEKKYKFEEMFGGYESKKLAKALSAHITEGLER